MLLAATGNSAYVSWRPKQVQHDPYAAFVHSNNSAIGYPCYRATLSLVGFAVHGKLKILLIVRNPYERRA